MGAWVPFVSKAILSVVAVAAIGGLAATATTVSAQDTSAAKLATPRTVVILPFDMVDTSLQGEMNGGPLQSDMARLDRTEQVVQRAMDHLDEFDVISRAPVEQRITEAQGNYRYLYACNGCDVDIGRAAGTDLVMTGWVQKVSNLILNINATLRRSDTGREVGGASVDMRNDTDASWRSAALYLVEHALLDNYRSRAREAVAPAQSPPTSSGHTRRVPIRHYPG